MGRVLIDDGQLAVDLPQDVGLEVLTDYPAPGVDVGLILRPGLDVLGRAGVNGQRARGKGQIAGGISLGRLCNY